MSTSFGSPARSIASVAFIGGGNVARSMIGGLVGRGVAAATIAVAEPEPTLRAALVRDFGVHTHSDNAEAVRDADLCVLAIKPQVMRAVCEALAPAFVARRPLIVSVAAGIPAARIEQWFGHETAIVRAMPNTPALVGASATALYANALATSVQREQATRLFEAVGIARWIADEALMDTITATSGSGPAYVFALVEAMQAAAVAQGLPADTARALIAQTVLGAGRMLVESGEDAATLRQRVTSPGGVTAQALQSFERRGFDALIAEAIVAATARGAELAAAQ